MPTFGWTQCVRGRAWPSLDSCRMDAERELRSTGYRDWPRVFCSAMASVVDCLNANPFETFDVVLHRLKDIGGVPLPICEFAGDQ